jgi:hypothetical protein
VVLDDSSRFILSGREFSAATTENSISLVRMALDDSSWVAISLPSRISTPASEMAISNKFDIQRHNS